MFQLPQETTGPDLQIFLHLKNENRNPEIKGKIIP